MLPLDVQLHQSRCSVNRTLKTRLFEALGVAFIEAKTKRSSAYKKAVMCSCHCEKVCTMKRIDEQLKIDEEHWSYT